jgi:hypothetical protein
MRRYQFVECALWNEACSISLIIGVGKFIREHW